MVVFFVNLGRVQDLSNSKVFTVEILQGKIRKDKEIQGINTFQRELRISQFFILLEEPTIFWQLWRPVGIRLNLSKTKALWLGPWKHYKKNPSDFCGLKSLFKYFYLTVWNKMKNSISRQNYRKWKCVMFGILKFNIIWKMSYIGGSVGEWLGCRILNPEVAGSSPALTT